MMDLRTAVEVYRERRKAAPNRDWVIVDTYAPTTPIVLGVEGELVYRDDTARRLWMSLEDTHMAVWDVRDVSGNQPR